MASFDGNCHTHTYRCKHARGDAQDYCVQAIRAGLQTLGFSDHCPLPDGRWPTVRMAMEELPGYCRALDQARLEFPQLRLLKGLECEYIPEFAAVYQDLFLGTWALDYLIGGAHYYPFHGTWLGLYEDSMDGTRLGAYVDYVIAGMESGLFAFVAHPDLFGVRYAAWDAQAEACSRALLAAAAALGTPLEINGYGLRKPQVPSGDGMRPMYPWLPFWELASQYDLQVVLSADAHLPEDIVAGLPATADIARRCGLHVLTNPVAPMPAPAPSGQVDARQ